MIKKMMEKKKKRSDSVILKEDQYIEIENPDGRKVFVSNPFYRGKDPMKEIYWKHKNADGTWGFVRNPFAPPPWGD